MEQLINKQIHKLCIVSFFGIYFCLIANGQKKIIDAEAVNKWPFISTEQISPDGRYISYYLGIRDNKYSSLVIKSTDGNWSREFSNGTEAVFTDDSRFLVFFNDDKLSILNIRDDSLIRISNVKSFKLNESGKESWIAYLLNDDLKTLVVKNLFTGKTEHFYGAEAFRFSPNGNRVAIEMRKKDDNDTLKSEAIVLTFPQISSLKIFTGADIVDFRFDTAGNQLAILAQEVKSGEKKNYIHYYRFANNTTEFTVADYSPGMFGLQLSNQMPDFSQSGNTLYLYLRDTTGVFVENKKIGSDIIVQKAEENDRESFLTPWNRDYLAAIQLDKKDLIVQRLIHAQDNIEPRIPKTDFFWFFRKGSGSMNKFYLSSSKGEITFLTEKDNFQIMISPTGKYVLWYDGKKCSWFTCQNTTGKITEITRKIAEPMCTQRDNDRKPETEFMLGWLPDDEYVLINDRYDIWKIDPNGIKAPLNITGGYGKKKSLKLRGLLPPNANITIDKLDSLIVMGFDLKNKEKGYFRLEMQKKDSLKIVQLDFGMMGTPFPSEQGNNSIGINSFRLPNLPKRAKYNNTWILTRSDNNHYPNIYTTKDFIHFNKATNLEPQKKYNWYQNELLHWEVNKGKPATGIIFKPENFDSSKKYPLIFYYYEKSSDAFNFFLQPAFSNGAMNIPWMVSRGYIVVVPDIYYQPGFSGDNAAQYIVSAANYLAQFEWIDTIHIGLQGHSHGGFETNSIITRSNKFAAAISASGVSNLTSCYFKNIGYYEFGQGRMGNSLWENFQGYIDQSPIFKVDRITTPLLLMHNEKDGNVPFNQSSDLFAAMKRLNKPCWFLNYKGEGHTIDNLKNAYDFTIKMTEFFDHYLKGAPLPEWMK
jgi:dipeptidyl aminopeptidase/acylaminoacyl peptidase